MKMNSTKFMLAACLLAIALVIGACGNIGFVEEDFVPLGKTFAYNALALSPTSATAAGYHVHMEGAQVNEETGALEGGTEVRMDALLDDYSSAGVQKQIEFFKGWESRLHSQDEPIDREVMGRDLWADYGVMENRVTRALFRLETEKPFTRDPNFYITLLGRALYTPVVLEYASEDERYGHIVERLKATPDFLATATSNLSSSSELQGQVAQQSAEGLIALINDEIARGAPAGKKTDYDAAAAPAVEALRDFASFAGGLSGGDWRLGRSIYDGKLQAVTGDGQKSSDALASDLETAFEDAYTALIEASKPVHRKIYGNQRAPNDTALMKDVLDVVGDDNRMRNAGGLVERVDQDVAEAIAFMKDQELVNFPSGVDIEVAASPSFLRALDPVSSSLPPPLLAAAEDGVAWVTPIPSDWSRARTLSQLREYNLFKLKMVAVEAVARFIGTAANATAEGEEWRKLLRNVDPNQGYRLGWTNYITTSTVGLGYQAVSEEFKVVALKHQLESVARALLDVRLHAMNMSEDEAVDLLRQRVFLDGTQAASVVRDVQVGPAEFALAYAGAQDWMKVRQFYQQATTDFSLSSFHGKALAVGPMPIEELAYLITDGKKME